MRNLWCGQFLFFPEDGTGRAESKSILSASVKTRRQRHSIGNVKGADHEAPRVDCQQDGVCAGLGQSAKTKPVRTTPTIPPATRVRLEQRTGCTGGRCRQETGREDDDT